MQGKWIEMFKTGTQTDSAGNVKEWTEQDLDAIVAKYNGQDGHEAPIVVGHPESNAPAFGWVEALKREGKLLYAKLKDVMPEFEELVKSGTYKKRSISLYPDWTLRHIGFLGGMPPAVKGLANVFKSGAAAITYEIDSCYNEPHKEESMDAKEVEGIVAKAVAAATQQFGEAMGKTIKGMEDQITALKQGQATDRETNQRREFNDFLATPEMQKRVNEGSRLAVLGQMMTLASAAPVEFGEGVTKTSKPALDVYKDSLRKLPEVVTFGEIATKDKAGNVTVNGMTAEALSQKAVEFQESEAKAGRAISITAAVNHVKTGGKP